MPERDRNLAQCDARDSQKPLIVTIENWINVLYSFHFMRLSPWRYWYYSTWRIQSKYHFSRQVQIYVEYTLCIVLLKKWCDWLRYTYTGLSVIKPFSWGRQEFLRHALVQMLTEMPYNLCSHVMTLSLLQKFSSKVSLSSAPPICSSHKGTRR